MKEKEKGLMGKVKAVCLKEIKTESNAINLFQILPLP